MQHRLTPVLRDLFVWPPQKSQKAALLRRPAPPSPKGGFERPVKHNAGGLCALVKGHGRCARRRSSSVRLRPHNPRYVQRAAAATALRSAAVRCGSRHVVHAPARPAVLPRRLQPLARLPFPPGQACRPSAPEGLPKTKDKAKKQRPSVPSLKESCACLPGSG